MLKEKLMISTALIITLLSSCANSTGTNSNMVKPSASTVNTSQNKTLSTSDYKALSDTGVSDDSNKFGFNILNELIKQDKDKNVFISPASISIALTMTYNGADGETKSTMEKTMQLSGIKQEDVNKAYNSLLKILAYADDKVKFNIANSLWVNKGTSLKPDFVKMNQDNFAAKLSELDFSTPDALTAINSWVNEKTQNKIPKIIEKIDPATILYLINAIYFKGSWAEKFDSNNTINQDFTSSDGKTKSVSMMNKSGDFNYYKGDKFQAVQLPYGNGKFSMYVFLPDENSSLDDFYKNLNQDNWKDWLNKFSKNKGKIGLPKFKSEYGKELSKVLDSLGMGIAFGSNADFSKMVNESVSISEVMHKTFIEVNEEGTEAAAATSVAITKNSIILGKEFNFVANRPFFIAITESQTGTILFSGIINNP